MLTATKCSKFDISLESETANLANKFSNFLNSGDVVFLYGEIGVGKTTFVRHLINNLQKKNSLKPTEITSPTFNLVNEYDVGSLIIHHYDLYRLTNSAEIKNIGLFENYKEILTLIEWPEKIETKIETKIALFFEYGKNLDKRFLYSEGINSEKLNAIK